VVSLLSEWRTASANSAYLGWDADVARFNEIAHLCVVIENLLNLSNGVSVEVDIAGPEEGSMIILLSGAGAPLQFWPASFVKALVSAGHRVVRYCHRDTGTSD